MVQWRPPVHRFAIKADHLSEGSDSVRFSGHKKAAFALLLFFIILCIGAVLFVFGRGTPEGNALREIGLARLRDYEAEGHDDHGGFHHDGTAFYQFTGFDPAQLEPLLEGKVEGWNPFPLDEYAACLIYGGKIDGESYGRRTVLIPPVDEGAWFFLDRQNEKDHYSSEDIAQVYHRPSANFTIAVYDSEKETLYYFRYDS